MKPLFLFLLFPFLAFAQDKLYLEFNEAAYTITDHPKDSGFYEYTLLVKNPVNNDEDFYTFQITSHDGTPLFDGGYDAKGISAVGLDKMKRMSSCELHDMLSKRVGIFLVFKNRNGEQKMWDAMYVGTYRNILKSRQSGKM